MMSGEGLPDTEVRGQGEIWPKEQLWEGARSRNEGEENDEAQEETAASGSTDLVGANQNPSHFRKKKRGGVLSLKPGKCQRAGSGAQVLSLPLSSLVVTRMPPRTILDLPSWSSIESPWAGSHLASLVTCPSGGPIMR